MYHLLLVFNMFFLTPVEHDIHVSICEIDIENEAVEITIKTFLDDLQIAVGLTPGEAIPEGYTSSDELIKSYLSDVFALSVNKKKVTLTIDDISAAQDAVWITIEGKLDDHIKSIGLDNSFLTELYRDQTNLVHIKVNGEKKSYTLNKKKRHILYKL